MSELTAALATIEKCREISGCPAGVDLQDWVKRLAAERDEALNAERIWEKTMMEVCGEDGPASVASEIRSLQALRDTAMQALKSQVGQLAAENARYSMSAGHADQRMAESRAVRSALGFNPDADDVSPSDLVEAINQTVAELCVIRTAHPQPLGSAMDAAIDAFNAEEMPETGMLNAYFILRDSIRIPTPATDRIVAGIKADAQSEVIEWLDAEITAIDTMYRGEPSYERDANWMKSEVLDVVELARKAFPAQLREGAK
ncbi:hypothetical protein KGP19_06350 [Raoultella planticola]|uniref:hypothetical protein n=1 Tax=Raoultella planticola TaxID=575 RepID=UPI001CBF27C7|nr:hypothetical protein [Raoultella planticola]UAN11871.1 hypothetical protein KGP19_06350 [Raoultella planticola]